MYGRTLGVGYTDFNSGYCGDPFPVFPNSWCIESRRNFVLTHICMIKICFYLISASPSLSLTKELK